MYLHNAVCQRWLLSGALWFLVFLTLPWEPENFEGKWKKKEKDEIKNWNMHHTIRNQALQTITKNKQKQLEYAPFWRIEKKKMKSSVHSLRTRRKSFLSLSVSALLRLERRRFLTKLAFSLTHTNSADSILLISCGNPVAYSTTFTIMARQRLSQQISIPWYSKFSSSFV